MVSFSHSVFSLSAVSPHTINSIASSLQNLTTGGSGGPSASVIERSLSRNSYSPAMSDSGISVGAASNSSGSNQPAINVAALAKLGTVNVNAQGKRLALFLSFYFFFFFLTPAHKGWGYSRPLRCLGGGAGI